VSLSVNLTQLRTEFTTDPSGIGYANFLVSNHQRLVYLVNTVSANSNTANSQISVGMVFALQMQQCVLPSEYSNLTTIQRDLWNAMVTTAIQGLVISSTVVRSQVSNIWSGTTTGANVSALFRRFCSRAETLFGEGAAVNANEASKAAIGDF
jgi:hypothetical protein